MRRHSTPVIPASAQWTAPGMPIVTVTGFAAEGGNHASTTIRFNAPGPSMVSIRVYDLLGRLVDAPVAEEVFDGGAGEVRYQADRLPSGVYHYRLEAVPVGRSSGRVVLARTMLLMK